jgi:hypothetical protein
MGVLRQAEGKSAIGKCMQFAYISAMKVTFFETSMFSATLTGYLDDDEYRHLQRYMLDDPECGAVMPRTGGFRKLRWTDVRRGKGKRGGLGVIYYWLSDDAKIWMLRSTTSTRWKV